MGELVRRMDYQRRSRNLRTASDCYALHVNKEYTHSVKAANAMIERVMKKDILKTESALWRYKNRMDFEKSQVQHEQFAVSRTMLDFNEDVFQKERGRSAARYGRPRSEKSRATGSPESIPAPVTPVPVHSIKPSTAPAPAPAPIARELTNVSAASAINVSAMASIQGGFRGRSNTMTSVVEPPKQEVTEKSVISITPVKNINVKKRRARTSLGFYAGEQENEGRARSFTSLREAYRKKDEKHPLPSELKLKEMQIEQRKSYENLLKRSYTIFEGIISRNFVEMNDT